MIEPVAGPAQALKRSFLTQVTGLKTWREIRAAFWMSKPAEKKTPISF